jgi:CBS domain-containing protein
MEEHEESLGKVLISEIKDLIIKNPTIIYKDTKIKDIMSAIIEDSRSRHAYVVDNSGKLIGSIRTNNIIQYLFPTTYLKESQSLQISSYWEFSNAKTAEDIMNKNPNYVYEHTNIKKLITIMISEKINEVPVIDKNFKLVGEVNVMEIIAKWLEMNQ